MMHRSRRRGSERRQVLPSSYTDDPCSHEQRPNKVPHEKTRPLSPDPLPHAKALVESFGARTALQIAQFNAQLMGPSSSYWANVLDNIVDAWGTQPPLRRH
jgi:hypothetical protein